MCYTRLCFYFIIMSIIPIQSKFNNIQARQYKSSLHKNREKESRLVTVTELCIKIDQLDILSKNFPKHSKEIEEIKIQLEDCLASMYAVKNTKHYVKDSQHLTQIITGITKYINSGVQYKDNDINVFLTELHSSIAQYKQNKAPILKNHMLQALDLRASKKEIQDVQGIYLMNIINSLHKQFDKKQKEIQSLVESSLFNTLPEALQIIQQQDKFIDKVGFVHKALTNHISENFQQQIIQQLGSIFDKYYQIVSSQVISQFTATFIRDQVRNVKLSDPNTPNSFVNKLGADQPKKSIREQIRQINPEDENALELLIKQWRSIQQIRDDAIEEVKTWNPKDTLIWKIFVKDK